MISFSTYCNSLFQTIFSQSYILYGPPNHIDYRYSWYIFPYINLPFHALCIFVPVGCVSMQADVFLAHASVFSGCVRPDECQSPLHRRWFRFWRSEVGEEEGQLPTSLLAITTAMKSIEEILSSILSSQTGEKKREREMINERSNTCDREGRKKEMHMERGRKGERKANQEKKLI